MGRAWSDSDLDALARDTRVAIARSPAARRGASTDFGNLVHGAPAAVAHPRDASEIARVLSFASAHALRVTVRALGLSQSGQAVAPPGVLTIAMTRLDTVGDVVTEADGTAHVICGAGTRFRDVIARAREHGMVPRVTPLNLDLTVGGVLSVGGMGSTSHRFGPLVANVASLAAVTGAGEHVVATRTTRSDVHDATLAGLGRAAVVCEATIALRVAQPRVTSFRLLYSDLETFLRDQKTLALCERTLRPDHVEGFVASSPFAPGAPLFVLQAGYEHAIGAGPSGEIALEGLTPWRSERLAETDTFAFTRRYEPRFEAMVRSGGWDLAHPWVETILPTEALARVLPEVLAALPPALGDGHRTQLFVAHENLPPFFAVPSSPSREMGVFAVLPMGVSAGLRDDVLAALTRVEALLQDAGGKRYVSGWLGPMGEAAWRRHYGDRYEAWCAAKQALDPAGVLTSALFA